MAATARARSILTRFADPSLYGDAEKQADRDPAQVLLFFFFSREKKLSAA
jgi:hypothetical protein